MEDARAAAARFATLFPAVYLRFHRRDGKLSGIPSASRAILEHMALAGPSTVGELSGHLNRAQSVVSEIVSHLEAADLLERHSDPKDRRRRLIWLSDQGRAVLARDREILSIDLLERAFAHLDPPTRSKLSDALDELLLADDAAGRAIAELSYDQSRSAKEPS